MLGSDFESYELCMKRRSFCVISAEWLLRIAPQYYELSNFPPCEARRQLELLQARLDSKLYQEGF